ncbi:amylo-alpha-1,6-glucosidase [Geomesophilobacter sediminis]|uniref:Glycogen debranching enzyme family protein n=1 Tax=Geomesophilobacter sediminis TaxID=2798584 RepID=A0A8J7M3E7_9BACT|nr:amylo-alpha-1,6-glucosidase [Geomesophilobacter sediminis]MBJ6728015.1 glycogen debranching enzyme family protein [Geomesophilobacter sediminis]
MPTTKRVLTWPPPYRAQELQDREWLVTNGLGGYASGTLNGVPTRRYHGLLIAAFPPPVGRFMTFNRLHEQIVIDGQRYSLSGESVAEGVSASLRSFTLEDGLPRWRYEIAGATIEKRIFLPHLQNTVHVMFRVLSSKQAVRLELRPSLHFRGHNEPVDHQVPEPYRFEGGENRYEVRGHEPHMQLRFLGDGPGFSCTAQTMLESELCYSIEQERGYECFGEIWSPGFFSFELAQGDRAIISASTESWETLQSHPCRQALLQERRRRRMLRRIAAPAARSGVAAELVIAADQFVTSSGVGSSDPELRRIMAGYHWFGDWGRDTMISLEGVTLATGKIDEGGAILRKYAEYIKDGLIPNMFPEGATEGVYNTADATLWYFHALDRYTEVSGERDTLRALLPKLRDIVEHHHAGTRFGIGVDPADGLLRQGAEGYQLTWMDAKVGDWVVTPRRGKAVEINALWYNALRLLQTWCEEESEPAFAQRLAGLAGQVYRSFNERFWYQEGGYLYDVVDGEAGDDPACRPNQLFTLSLRHSVLDPARWHAVLDTVQEQLLTPVGLRTLSWNHPDYKRRYTGDLRSRDAAYHQGTVWPWLIGPFIDAWLRVNPGYRKQARAFLNRMCGHLDDQCIGTIGEICDAEEPFTPRGCIAQAWSVAEVLRCWMKTEG